MYNKVKITVLIDNKSSNNGLKSEHGLSLWIQYQDKNILFDTGQSDTVLSNAKKLDISIENADAIVLSHGHYDHTGGLNALLPALTKQTIYGHPWVTNSRFNHIKNRIKYIGMSEGIKAQIEHAALLSTKHCELFPNIHITGQIPRMNSFEDVGESFYLDAGCQVQDCLLDDQALFIDTPRGIIAVVGCCHAGLINTLNYIKRLVNKPIHSVIGGMHLQYVDEQRISKTTQAMANFNIKKIVPLHCSGQWFADYLNNNLDSIILPAATGSVIEL